jgi:NADP-dependent 3-hydroxy acid dehydrogenase YdfG
MDLIGQVALVTGASSGIGEATAKALADEGVRMGLAARREERLEEVANHIRNIGGEAIALPTDIRDEEQVAAMVEETESAFGSLDILVNNAGVARRGLFASTDREDVRQQVEVNLLGTLNVTHEVLPAMIESGGGDIVVVSSVNAKEPAEGASTYSGTKSGINGFCDALRKEVADEGVRVTVVMPGAVDTEAVGLGDVEDVLDPADVADTITFAVSRPDNVLMAEFTVAASPPLPYR